MNKNIFLANEGDNYFIRNRSKFRRNFPELKALLQYLDGQEIKTFLDIGCSDGKNTKILARKMGADGYGIDPSSLAIKKASQFNFYNLSKLLNRSRTNYRIGTADCLPFQSHYFDLIYFSFSLYLVDRTLLSESLFESNRCLKPGGFIAIKDFDYGVSKVNDYRHSSGIKSFKDDYSEYFLRLGYKLVCKESYKKEKIGFESNPDDRVGFWLLYKP
jgi:SAM-dependent methyltransferase